MHTLKLPLILTNSDKKLLEKRFRLLAHIHNVLVKHVKKLLRILAKDNQYQTWLAEYRQLAEGRSNGDKDAISKSEALAGLMNSAREKIGLTKPGLENYVKVQQHMFTRHISSQQAQVEAGHVWSGAEKVIFGSGMDVHFKKEEEFHTIGAKSLTNGIRPYTSENLMNIPKSLQGGLVHEFGIEYLGLDFGIKLPKEGTKNRAYADAAMAHKLKYVHISREIFPSGWRYYAILYYDGPAPKTKSIGSGVMGCDPGVSTIACDGDNGMMLEEIAPDAKKYNKRMAKLQRRIDASTRQSNPDNYNADGTVKKGKHKWHYSKNCLRKKRLLKAMYRKKSAYIKCDQGNRANRILGMCDTVKNESMDYQALAKRSKKPAQRSEKGTQVTMPDGSVKTIHKFKKKKRFGSSFNDRAPSQQITIIKNKMIQYGGIYMENDARITKASQYDHSTGECHKVPLSTRTKQVGGHKVQRDLYSAFIHHHADPSTSLPDRKACIKDFDRFLHHQEELISTIKQNIPERPSCFGF